MGVINCGRLYKFIGKSKEQILSKLNKSEMSFMLPWKLRKHQILLVN